jgi:hypothetical protein
MVQRRNCRKEWEKGRMGEWEKAKVEANVEVKIKMLWD